MEAMNPINRRRAAHGLLASTLLAACVVAAGSTPAHAAVGATFSAGSLTVTGDGLDNAITISRNAAGTILVNGGAVAVAGGTPTVANTATIRVFGLGGNDVVTLSETNGALPKANLFGGVGNDVLTGGSDTDQLFGEGGNDTLLGKGSADLLFGGADNDTLTGGDADDEVFGQSGNDRMVWNPGDDTDLNEGAAGIDTVEVNGGNGTEQFTATANGTRVRFDRVNPAPFAIDIGTSENLVLNANGGDDQFSATGNLAPRIKLTIDGGSGADTLLGGNGADIVLGGDGNDLVDGQQGADVAFLGAGDDTAQWDPGDGSDVIEGQDGTDTMAFNGSNIGESFAVFANGGRVRFTRNVANIVMDLNDVEIADVRALGGADTLVAEDLSGTDLVDVRTALGAFGGGDDGAADTVVARGTNGDDVVTVAGSAGSAQATGLPARVAVTGAVAGSDRLTVETLAGGDVADASSLAANAVSLTLDGGAGDDVLLGGGGVDTLLGGEGDDVLLGGPGADVIDGGPGDNVVIQGSGADTVRSARTADRAWLASHTRQVDGKAVVEVDGTQRTLPQATTLSR